MGRDVNNNFRLQGLFACSFQQAGIAIRDRQTNGHPLPFFRSASACSTTKRRTSTCTHVIHTAALPG